MLQERNNEIKYYHYSTEKESKHFIKLNIKEIGTNKGYYQIKYEELVSSLYCFCMEIKFIIL